MTSPPSGPRGLAWHVERVRLADLHPGDLFVSDQGENQQQLSERLMRVTRHAHMIQVFVRLSRELRPEDALRYVFRVSVGKSLPMARGTVIPSRN